MVNVETVYQRVLLLANKEQRGYITPEEYNSFAEQAQLEIFEDYFIKKVQASQAPMTTDEYGDLMKLIEERITYFDNTTDVASKTELVTGTMGFVYPDNFYSLGMVHVNSRTIGGVTYPVMADEVSHRDLAYINLSPLTAPTAKQPVYTRHENGVVVYPSSVSSVNFVYLRRPNAPMWAFMDAPTGEPIYDAANSINFELNPAEEFNLVYRILTMAGVAIKQADIAQYAQQNEN